MKSSAWSYFKFRVSGDWISFYSFLISAFLGEDKFICVRCFEIIGEYSAAACTRSGAFLIQVYHHYMMMMITQAKDSHISIFWGKPSTLYFVRLSRAFPDIPTTTISLFDLRVSSSQSSALPSPVHL